MFESTRGRATRSTADSEDYSEASDGAATGAPAIVVDSGAGSNTSSSGVQSRASSPTKQKSRKALIADLQAAFNEPRHGRSATPAAESTLSVATANVGSKSATHSRAASPSPFGDMKLSAKVLALLEDELQPPEGWSKARMYVHKRFPASDHKKKVMKQLFDIETPDELEKKPNRKLSAPPKLNPVLMKKKAEDDKRKAERAAKARVRTSRASTPLPMPIGTSTTLTALSTLTMSLSRRQRHGRHWTHTQIQMQSWSETVRAIGYCGEHGVA